MDRLRHRIFLPEGDFQLVDIVVTEKSGDVDAGDVLVYQLGQGRLLQVVRSTPLEEASLVVQKKGVLSVRFRSLLDPLVRLLVPIFLTIYTVIFTEHGGELVPAQHSTVLRITGIQLCHPRINYVTSSREVGNLKLFVI